MTSSHIFCLSPKIKKLKMKIKKIKIKIKGK